jgi:hypothetical protein
MGSPFSHGGHIKKRSPPQAEFFELPVNVDKCSVWFGFRRYRDLGIVQGLVYFPEDDSALKGVF